MYGNANAFGGVVAGNYFIERGSGRNQGQAFDLMSFSSTFFIRNTST